MSAMPLIPEPDAEPPAPRPTATAPAPSPIFQTSPLPSTTQVVARPDAAPMIVGARSYADDLIAQASKERAPVEYLRELFALKKEIDAHQAFAAFQDARASFAAEAVVVLKRKHVHFETRDRDTKRVTGTVDYWHAELSDVVEAVAPVLGRYGLSYSWVPDFSERGRIKVACVLRHRLGHEERIEMSGPLDDSGKKNVLQQQQSTVTYLQRHTLKAITGIAEKGDDDDGRTGRGESAMLPEDGMPNEFRTSLGSRAGAAPAEKAEGTEEERDKLIADGEDKALDGMAALSPWWQGLTARQRNLVGAGYGPLKTNAAAIDRDRAAGKGLHDEPGQRP